MIIPKFKSSLVLVSLAAGLLAISPGARAASIRWKGYFWSIKSGRHSNPGHNDWNPNNVFVDTNGFLHLKITYNTNSGNWDCAGLYTTSRLRFGTYQWEVEGRLDQLDRYVVLGLFPYAGPPGLNEIDIEYTRWGKAANHDCWWTIYPNSGTTVARNNASFNLSETYTTSRLTWSSSGVHYWHMGGFQPIGTIANLFAEWNCASSSPAQNIPQQAMPLHMNLWLYQGHAPANGQSVEVIIHDFTTTGATNAALTWAGDGIYNTGTRLPALTGRKAR
jgi:hypothetical protein